MAHRLVEPGGGKYLPFAESKLTGLLQALGGADFTRIFRVGGSVITVQQRGGQQFIHISGGPQRFEFYTSGFPVSTYTITQGSYTFKAYDVGIVSTLVRGASFKPLLVGNKRLSYAAGKPDAMTFGRHNWQVQLGHVPYLDAQPLGTNHKKLKFAYTTSHVNLPTTGHTFAHVLMPFWSGYEGHAMQWLSDTSPAPKAWNFATRDVGYDVLNYRFDGNSPLGVKKALPPDSDWPRFWGIQEVTADVAGVSTTFLYGVAVDATGAWYAFPLSAMGDVTLSGTSVPLPNLTGTNSRTVTPTYPSWVWRGDAASTKIKDQTGQYVVIGAKNPEFRWEFNHLGTKACAIAYARVAMGAFETAWYTGGTPLTLAEYNATCQYNNPWPVPSGISPFAGGFGNAYEDVGLPRNFAGPGIIEAAPVITKAPNADPNDFSFAVTITSVADPLNDAVALPLAVGYLWHAPEGGQTCVPGDLLVLEVESYYNTEGAGAEYLLTKILRVRNATQSNMVLSNMRGWVRGMDLRTLSFYMQSMMTSTSGPSHTVDRGTYFPGEPVPAGLQANYTDTFVTARPYNYVVAKGALVKVFMPDDIPSELTALAATISARTLAEMVDVTYTVPSGATMVRLNSVMTPTALRNNSVDRTTITMWFGDGVRVALTWSAVPSGLSGYPIGWMRATVEALTYLQMPMVDTTFYVHPSGTWAVCDTSNFYNTLGVPKTDSTLARVCNTGSLLSADQFKWFVVDSVNIRKGKDAAGQPSFRSTTFRELYNGAVAKHVADPTTTTAEFQPLVWADVLPTFSIESHYVVNYTTPSTLGTNEFVLKITWADGTALYRRLSSFHTGGMLFPDPTILSRHQAWPGWCLLGDANDMMFSDSACTSIAPSDGMYSRYTFRISSPRLIGTPKD